MLNSHRVEVTAYNHHCHFVSLYTWNLVTFLVYVTKYDKGNFRWKECAMTHVLRKDIGHCGDKVIAQGQEVVGHILSAFRKSRATDPLPLFVFHL